MPGSLAQLRNWSYHVKHPAEIGWVLIAGWYLRMSQESNGKTYYFRHVRIGSALPGRPPAAERADPAALGVVVADAASGDA
jgi:hypothetical protein